MNNSTDQSNNNINKNPAIQSIPYEIATKYNDQVKNFKNFKDFINIDINSINNFNVNNLNNSNNNFSKEDLDELINNCNGIIEQTISLVKKIQ
jgi:hypothetical protein